MEEGGERDDAVFRQYPGLASLFMADMVLTRGMVDSAHPRDAHCYHFDSCPPVLLERLERTVAALDEIDRATLSLREAPGKKHQLRNAIESAMVLLQSMDDYLHGVANLGKNSCLVHVNEIVPANRIIKDLANLHKHGKLTRECWYFREAPRHDEVEYVLDSREGARPLVVVRGLALDATALLVEGFASQVWFISHHYSVGQKQIRKIVGRRWKGSLWRPLFWPYVTIFWAGARRSVPYVQELDTLMHLCAAEYLNMGWPRGPTDAIVYEFGTSFALHTLQHERVRDALILQGTGNDTRFTFYSAKCTDTECGPVSPSP